MIISKIDTYIFKEKLKTPFIHASSGLISALDGVFVKITAEDGTFGFGEVRGNCEYFTGDNANAIISVIRDIIAPKLIGVDAKNLNMIHNIIEKSIVKNMAAKAVCECAAFDLAGKITDMPCYRLLGGRVKDILPSEENIPFMSAEDARIKAEKLLDDGCRFIKVRVGSKDFSHDESRVKSVWEVICRKNLENEVIFSVDANQAWDTKTAINNINKLSIYGVSIAEQLVHDNSPIKLKELKNNCNVKLFGDECVATVEDLVRYIELGCIDGVHIKIVKCGGIINAMKMMTIAKAHQIDYMIGGMDEGMLAVAAAVQCAAVSDTELFEVHGHVRIEYDPTTGLEVVGSDVLIPDAPGLGVIVNENVLTFISSVV